MELNPTLLVIASILLVFLIPAVLYPNRALRWLQIKRYQYETTFGLYMMTPTEKFILNSFLFLTFSMIIIAASLYLPEHILTISHRAFYYYSGASHPDSPNAAAGSVVPEVSSHVLIGSSTIRSHDVISSARAVVSAGVEMASEGLKATFGESGVRDGILTGGAETGIPVVSEL